MEELHCFFVTMLSNGAVVGLRISVDNLCASGILLLHSSRFDGVFIRA